MRTLAFVLGCLACAGLATADSAGATAKAFMPARTLPRPTQDKTAGLEPKIAELQMENDQMMVDLAHLQYLGSEKQDSGYSHLKFGCGLLGFGLGGAMLYSILNKLAAKQNQLGSRVPDVQMAAFDPEVYPGVQPPTGFWDPLGLCTDIDEAKFLRWRSTEIKHGRVSMVACLGYIVPYWFRWPGTIDVAGTQPFTDVPTGIAALKAVPDLGWLQIIAFCGLLEVGPFRQIAAEFPGDAGWDPLNLAPEAPDQLLAKKNAELANGRLAMLAIMGFLVQDVINNGNPYAPFYDPDDVL